MREETGLELQVDASRRDGRGLTAARLQVDHLHLRRDTLGRRTRFRGGHRRVPLGPIPDVFALAIPPTELIFARVVRLTDPPSSRISPTTRSCA